MADNEEPVVEEREAPGPDLGARLREARESRDLSIEEIATELRIEPHLLRALEECRFEAIGAPVFAKGYLKQYGTRLGLDYRELLGSYYDIVGRTEIEIAPSRAIKLRDERQITVWVIAALAIGLLAVLLFLWWIDQPIVSTSILPSSSSAVPAAPDATPGTASLERSSAGVAGAGVSSRAPADTAAETRAGRARAAAGAGTPPAAVDRPADTAADSAADPAAADPASGFADPAAGPAGPAAGAAGEAAGSTVALDPRALRVELVFTEECWAEITDVDGVRHFYGLAAPGRRESFAALPPLRVSVGNAGGIEITVNGRPYPVPGRGRSGDVARFTIDAITD